MKISTTLARAAAIAAAAAASAVASTAEWTGEGANALNSASYVKVMENSGPLAGTWSLVGITAWNGAEQVAFTCVSNRPYAAANAASAQGAMPAGNYVHQLSVFNQWDGSRTHSYRVQLAQPVGGNDIYARVTAVTVSQEGVNLVDYPDIRDFKDDATKIAASYTDNANLANFPVTKLKFKKQTGYLESEGDAFISLGHCAGPNTRIELDFELTEVTVGKIPFGSYGDSSTGNPQFELFISYSSSSDTRPRYSWRFSGANFVRQTMNCDLADSDRHVISFDATTRTYTSGSYTYTFDNPMLNQKSACPLSVFGRSVSSVATKPDHFGGATKMKVYGVNIYESGMLVKCFVPCVRGGIPGLIDTCNNAFVTGVDVSKVKHGGDIATVKDDPYVATSVNDVYGGTVVGKRIYLNTGYYVKKNARVELDMAPLTPPWTTANPYGNHLFMHAQGPNSQYMYIINLKQTSASPLYWKVGTKEDTAGDIQFSYATDIRRTFTFSSNTFQVVTAGYTNLTRTATAAQSIQNDLTTYPLHLASYSNGSGAYGPMKIYGLKIFEDNVLVKDFKPFVTNGVPGLIDALNPSDMRFFTTYGGGSKGTNLVAEVGGNLDSLTSVREREAYLEFPETGSGIDTGYSVGRDSCIEADLSLWKAGIGSQELINQDAGSDSCYVAFTSAGGTKQIWFKYADTSGNTAATIYTVNDRTQFFADRHTGNLTIKRGDAELYNKAMDTNYACTRTGGSQTLKIGRSNAAMRLYGFKIYEYVNDLKTPVRDFVPCVTNGVAGLYDLCGTGFYPLTGGKVSGKTAAGVDAFVTVPQPARLTRNGAGSTATLTCFAPSAQSYEWYEDGVLMPGETSNALTLNWERTKADNYIHTYSVKPVYEVFNETVRGEAVSAAVEYIRSGTTILVR